MLRKFSAIFFLAFAANFIWENLHAPLYANYKGGAVTEWVLLHATFWDAVIITSLSAIFIFIPYLRKNLWWAIVCGAVIAVIMEKWALATHRWAYGSDMPVIPFLNTGLTPTIQLGVLAFCIYFFVLKTKI